MGNIFKILLALSPALESGKSLDNSATWSNVSSSTHALVAVMGFILLAAKSFNFDIPISDNQLFQLAGAIASVGGTVTTYLHFANNPARGIAVK